MHAQLKLGKKPAIQDSRDFRFSQFVKKLPTPPKTFGHERSFNSKGWGVLGNDEYGDCVFAGAAHEHMLWTAVWGKPAVFSTKGVLSDYTAVTGFDPNDPATDQGTVMRDALNYRRKVGVVDAAGNRHKIAAYVRVSDFREMLVGLWMFGAVAMGFAVPETVFEQLDAGKPWTPVKGARIVGGHYVPVVSRRGQTRCITWGQTQPFSRAFYETYADECYVLLSEEYLEDGKSPEGFDMGALKDALRAL